MSNEPFTDEILSAIIDGEADPETVAAVAADPAASARLAQLEAVVSLVSVPVPDAAPERRNASIAAAMAAATPAAPEVTSLAAARHVRDTKTPRLASRRWLGVAAAAVAVVVAVPLLANLASSDSEEMATASDERALSAEDASDAVDDSSEITEAFAESDSSADSGAEAPASDDAAMDAPEAAMDEQTAADEAMDDVAEETEEQAAEVTTTAPAEAVDLDQVLIDAPVFSNVEILNELIALGSIAPELTLDDVIALGVSPGCAEPLARDGVPSFSLAYLDTGDAERRLILVAFDEDQTTMALDAEDCSQLG